MIPGLIAMDLGHADTTAVPMPAELTSEETPDKVISIHALKDSWIKWKASRKQQSGQPALFWDPAQGCDCDFTMECVSDRECHHKGERDDECHLSDCCGTFCVSIG